MKTQLFIYFSFVIILLISCNNSPENKADKIVPSIDTLSFFPLNDYLMQQIKFIDSAATFIYKITIVNGQRDSSVIDISEFNIWASKFIEVDISDPASKKFYKQDIFLDKTIGSFTFSYTCTNDHLPLRNVDILIDEKTQEVKRVFIQRSYQILDSMITEKMGWKNNSNFYVNRIIDRPGVKEAIQQNIIGWKFMD